MIYLDVTGRCGNQLFQYSFLRKSQIFNKRNNDEIIINFYNVFRWGKKTKDNSFSDQLKHFNVVPYRPINCDKNIVMEYGSKKQKRIFIRYNFFKSLSDKLNIGFFAKAWHGVMQRNGIYYEDTYFGIYKKARQNSDIFIKGYFEDASYYFDIAEFLRNELTVKDILSCSNLMPSLNKNSQSVCVSIRIWNEISSDLKKSREVCGYNYYYDAVKKMKELVPNAVFFVFSNDVEQVKLLFPFLKESTFEPAGLEIFQKMHLMSSCEHFIISTSTFSWWSAFLGKKNNTIIISPSKWYNDKDDNRLITHEMIKI